jgi:nicotinate-nucleotide adenylyltransferase
MLHFWKSREPFGRRAGILPGAFNPVTMAHLELARAAMHQYDLDEVLFLLPHALPHKEFTGASFNQRLEMLRAALDGEPRFSIGSTDQGLFSEIARECRPVYGRQAEFFFICGRDAADRVAAWDYGPGASFTAMLGEFQLLVAPRSGACNVAPEHAARVHPLEVAGDLESFSSSAVREAIAANQPWDHLVPSAAADVIRRDHLYAPVA